CLVPGDVPERVVSQWATSSERRKVRVQHHDMEGRGHDRYSRGSICRDWRFPFSGSVRLPSAGCERYFGRQHKTFSATLGVVPTEQTNSLVTFSTRQVRYAPAFCRGRKMSKVSVVSSHAEPTTNRVAASGEALPCR